MNAADLRSAYSPRQLHLLTEALERVRGRRYAMTDCLEGDDSELQVFRFIHLAHPAFADWPNDAETSKHELAWLKTSSVVVQESIEISEWSVKRSRVFLFGLEKLLEAHL